MGQDEQTDPDSLSERLEGLARGQSDLFEAQLRAFARPRIEEFLEGLGAPYRPIVLRALLVAERDWTREQGESLDVESLLSRFPDDSAIIEEIFGTNDSTLPLTGLGSVHVDNENLADSRESPRRYAILRRHAKGGQGVVNLALDRSLHREVAIKEIQPDAAHDLEYRARFIREAEITARLEHPGIVPVYGIGHYRNGLPYYVMRFIRGETLKDAIVRLHNPDETTPKLAGSTVDPDRSVLPRPTLHQLVGRLVEACQAIAYAHHRKVLHRDIKPGNIMLGPFGETLVVDWGLAKTIGSQDDDEHREPERLRPEADGQMTTTRFGSQIGTFGFMSPEQATGPLAELQPTSDIYSLGVTLYTLMTGKTPFDGSKHDECIRDASQGIFRKPSEVNSQVPRALEAICLKAMALRPEDRYQSAEALAEDLERWRAGEPVEPYAEPPLDRLARWSRRHRTALVASAVLLVTTTIGLGVLAYQERLKNERIGKAVRITRNAEAVARNARQVAEDAQADAILGRSAAREDLKLTRQSLRNLMDGLSGSALGYLPNSGGPRFALASHVLDLYRELIVKHPDDPDVKYELALASKTTANIGRTIGLFDQSHKLHDQAIDLLTRLLEESPGSDDYRIELSQALHDKGINHQMAGQVRASEPLQVRALEVLGRNSKTDPAAEERSRRVEALALLDLAAARIEMHRAVEARPAVEKCAGLLKTLAEKPDANPIDRLFHVYAVVLGANLAVELGRNKEAWTHFDEAARLIRALRQVPERDNPDLQFADAMILKNKGWLFLAEQHPTQALAAFDEAFGILRAILLNSFRPQFIEKEMANIWIGRATARIELLGAQPDPTALNQIQRDLAQAQSYLQQLADGNRGHYAYEAMLGQDQAVSARLARITSQPDESRRCLEQALAHFQRAAELNPDDRESRKQAAVARENLDKLPKTDPTATAKGP